MLADLDLLFTIVFCIADDFLPSRRKRAEKDHRRRDRDTVRGTGDDGHGLRCTVRRGRPESGCGICSRRCPTRDALHKRRIRLSGQIEALIAAFRAPEPRVLRRSAAGRLHPGRVRPLARNRQARRAVQPRRRAHRRRRLRLLRQPQPPLLRVSAARPVRPRRHPTGAGADHPEDRREARLPADGRPLRTSARSSADPDRRQELPRQGLRDRTRQAGGDDHAPPPQGRARTADRTSPRSASGSVDLRTCKDILTLERHGARTLSNLRVRLCARFAALAAAVMLNHQLDLPAAPSASYTA